jgi:DNA adenine methylase
MSIYLKTPISYYGGKQRLASKIISLIPKHTLYCEPFIGGGAVFFAKAPSPVEVLNDTNGELMNFYTVLKNHFSSLEKEIQITVHSRELHRKASVIYNHPDLFSEVKRAWAVWVLSTQSFGSQLGSGFGYDKQSNTTTKKIINNRNRFTNELATRMQNCQFECADALYVIKSRDTENSFFYCDPPYFNSDCGHYKGYGKEDFKNLLEILSQIKGKFLLSSYPSGLLDEYVQKYSWYTWSLETNVSVGNKGSRLKRKIEVLTANYPIESL